MSAATATAALTAGVATFDAVPDAPGGAQRCIRRAGSTWSLCRCESCLVRRRREQKLFRCGVMKLPNRDAAMLQLQAWIDRGWQPSAIASATGITPHGAQQLMFRMRAGVAYLQGSTVEKVLAAQRPTKGRIDACGPRRRLQALAWMGWTLKAVHERTGIPMMTLSYLRSGGIVLVAVRSANAIADLYEELQYANGGSQWVRNVVAERKGWAPPAAWDEDTIDDPQAEPEGIVGRNGEGQGPKTNDPVLVDEVRVLFAGGLTDTQIGYRVGLTASGVQKLRTRNGIRRAA